MTKTKNIKKNITIDLATYFNGDTGESLASELVSMEVKTTVSIMEDTELITMSRPKDFAFINTGTLLKIIKILNNADLAQLTKLIPLTKTEMNMVYNHSVPHTNATLQKYLEIGSRSKFTELMRRLIKAGVLYQIKGSINGAVRVVYILNPYFSNKRRTFHNSLFDIFKDFED